MAAGRSMALQGRHRPCLPDPMVRSKARGSSVRNPGNVEWHDSQGKANWIRANWGCRH